MKRGLINKVILLLAVFATVLYSLFYHSIPIMVVVSIGLALFLNEQEVKENDSIPFNLGVLFSLVLFGFYPIWALFIFEGSRLYRKGYDDLKGSLFSLVPIVTILLIYFEPISRDPNYLIYYFVFSFVMIFIEGIQKKKDWASLVILFYFILSNDITFFSQIIPYVLGVSLAYLILFEICLKETHLFNIISLSALGLCGLTFSINQILSLVVTSLIFEAIIKMKLVSKDILQVIYVFTLFYFAKGYFTNIDKIENLFPAFLLLAPLITLANIEPFEALNNKTQWDKFKSSLILLFYTFGVFIYAN